MKNVNLISQKTRLLNNQVVGIDTRYEMLTRLIEDDRLTARQIRKICKKALEELEYQAKKFNEILNNI
jgi:uncharacterized protein (UPF0147 family)